MSKITKKEEREDYKSRTDHDGLVSAGNEVTLKRVRGAGHAFTIYRKEKHQEGFDLMVKFARYCLLPH